MSRLAQQMACALIGMMAVAGSGAHTLGDPAHGLLDRETALAGHHAHGRAPATDAVAAVRSLVADYCRHGDDGVLVEVGPLLEPLLEARPMDLRARLAAAWVAQAEHRFEDAQGHLNAVLAGQPDNGEAWLLRSGLALLSGDRAEAASACRSASALVPAVATVACLARVRGQTLGAVGACSRASWALLSG